MKIWGRAPSLSVGREGGSAVWAGGWDCCAGRRTGQRGAAARGRRMRLVREAADEAAVRAGGRGCCAGRRTGLRGAADEAGA